MKIYRNEIDGLRAISVLAVLFYHSQIYLFDYKLFAYGFLGVDIFFVISGYLITNILFTDFNKNKFREIIYNFYTRRIRRIIPLLFFLVLISLLFGKIILISSDYIDLENSSIFTIFFSSNFYFYQIENDYFAKSSLLLPLLHTWSLAVEEQFYILFPFIFLIFKKFNFKHDLLIISLLILFSLSSYLLIKDTNKSLSFYLFVTRFWEILAGALIFYIGPNIKKNNLKFLNFWLTFILIIIIFILFAYENRILIVIFSTLLILFYKKDCLISKILENKNFIFIGKISFSIYLWHFIVFAFARYLDYFEDYKFFLISLIFILSYLSYIYIEKPFRSISIISDRKFKFYIGGLIFIIITLISFDNHLFKKEIVKLKGYDFFVNERANFANSNIVTKQDYLKSNKKKIIILGNSHAGDINNAILVNLEKVNENLFYFINRDYAFSLDCVTSIIKGSKENCFNLNEENYKKVSELFNIADGFIVSTQYNKTTNNYKHFNDNEFKNKLGKRKLLLLDEKVIYATFGDRQLTYYDIFFDKNNNIYNSNLTSRGDLDSSTSRKKFNKIYFKKRVLQDYNKEIKKIAYQNAFYFISNEEIICDKNKYICYGVLKNGDPTYFDASHYTLSGAKFFGNRLINHKVFKEFLKK